MISERLAAPLSFLALPVNQKTKPNSIEKIKRKNSTMKLNNPQKMLGLSFAAAVLVARTVSAQISIDTRPVSDAGNAAAGTGYGAVAYNYNIGTTEVTANQYTAFLNAVAQTDTYGLYNVNMGTYLRSQSITRSGLSGSYTYAVISGNGNLPVSFVGWGDAARFVNWMHNGQPTGAQNASTTENGAYTLNGAMGVATLSITRNAGWTYGLPTENEWVKAAFYTPSGGGSYEANYNTYATQFGVQPNSRNGSATDPNSANYFYDDSIVNGYNGGLATVNGPEPTPRVLLLTDAGAFNTALSYYGTHDQSGNVTEITEALNGAGTGRILRGGAPFNTTSAISITGRGTLPAADEYWDAGFRIVTVVPEPTTMSLMLMAGLSGIYLRQRRQVAR